MLQHVVRTVGNNTSQRGQRPSGGTAHTPPSPFGKTLQIYSSTESDPSFPLPPLHHTTLPEAMAAASLEKQLQCSHSLLQRLQVLQRDRMQLLQGKPGARGASDVPGDVRRFVGQVGMRHAAVSVLDALLAEGDVQGFGDALAEWLGTRAPPAIRDSFSGAGRPAPAGGGGGPILAKHTMIHKNPYIALGSRYQPPPMPTCPPTMKCTVPPEYLPPAPAGYTPMRAEPMPAPLPVPSPVRVETPARPPSQPAVEAVQPSPAPAAVAPPAKPAPAAAAEVAKPAPSAGSGGVSAISMMRMTGRLHKIRNKAQQHLQEKKEVIQKFFDRVEEQGAKPTEEPERVKQLAKGSYGVVDHVRYNGTGREVARKRVELTQETCSCVADALYKTRQIEREIHMSEFSCSYILKSQSVYVNRQFGEIYLESELMDGDLEKLLQKLAVRKLKIPDPHAGYIMFCVISALQYLHTKDKSYGEGGVSSFVHRDLKPNNILLNRQGKVLMTDFGVSKEVKSVSDQGAVATEVGNYAYMSPEAMMTSSTYARSSDLWSAGMITLHLLCGRHPIVAQGYELCQRVQKFDFSNPVGWEKPQSAPEPLDFVSKLLTKESKRMTAGESLKHEFLDTFKSNEEDFCVWVSDGFS